jgi:hypothetical protein
MPTAEEWKSFDKTIVNCSPPGSGGIFARELIKNNLKVKLIWARHALNELNPEGINICIIRDPYDCLASGIEVGFIDKNHRSQEQINYYASNTFESTLKVLPRHLQNYYEFLDACTNLKYVTTISFELLKNDPEKFLKYISEKFEIGFKDSKNRVSAENTKIQIANDPNHGTRVPRDTTRLRKDIDVVVRGYGPIEHAYKKYIILRDNIQLTENML